MRSDPGAMLALLHANKRAGEIRDEKEHAERKPPPGVVRGAPTHSLAYLLMALEESGWSLRHEKPLAAYAHRRWWERWKR